MLKSLKNNKKKGFTLVELIVVLVILAILAALLIPALTGYIDKAKEKQIIAETRQVVMAAQTLADEYYGAKDVDNVTFGAGANIELTKVAELAEVDGNITSITAEDGKISEVKYTNSGITCTYTPDGGYNFD
ncbi:MAG: prepilin-type N-terminal cleavage/methylation domain-containing protein [Lachnospiraceae bacterium]|nr:prepilin-type N-terminal cleavage/methylation domain-containing protein [Lachnospiraceae bacterium]